MTSIRVQDGAGHRLDEIYVYTRDSWGEAQAESYIRGLFERFQAIADRRFPWRPIPAEFGVDGYVCRYEKQFIYWRLLGDGSIGIVTILHQRMHQLDRFREDSGACPPPFLVSLTPGTKWEQIFWARGEHPMKPKIAIITLGVADVARSVRFYRDGLGFPMHNFKDGDDFAMFALEGTWLALYPREALAEDAQVSSAGSSFPGFSLSHNEPSPEAVAATFAEAIAVGATSVKRPEKVFWGGYSGYFADPDGYLWEVAHNPFTDLT